MALLTLKVLSQRGTLGISRGENEVSLVYTNEYQEGDRIALETSEENLYVMIQIDDAMLPSFVYLTKQGVEFIIPFGEKRICYAPKVFSGNKHLITARIATKEEISSYRNLALNPMDQHGDTYCYPHATANVETRGEAVFAARNAIDGIKENRSHGEWPYGSWGINRNPDATMKVEFGRTVEIDKIVLYLRADFPHDSWWKEVTICFSDGTSILSPLTKTGEAQTISFEKKKVEWIQLEKLLKADDPSPFPALTQLEVYGRDVQK